jgi:plastocyanin
MPDWSIKIVPVTPSNPAGPAQFNPSPQPCLVSDNISWNNQTDEEHQPWPLGSDGQPAATGWGVNMIPAGQSSNPSFSVPASPTGIVKYCCKKHQTELGQLEVLINPPTS